MRRKSPKKSLLKPMVLLVLLISVLLFAWYRLSLRPVSPDSDDKKIFVVPQGQPTDLILQDLQKEGLVRSATVAKLYLLLSGNKGSLQAGLFRLSPSMELERIIEELQYGTLDVWVTIPEGWRAEQVVDELLKKGLLNEEDRKELYQQFRQEEGRLFPDTYLFAHDSTAEQIIGRLAETFVAKTEQLDDGLTASNAALAEQQLILASLVEREAKRDEDRPLIASVLKNRLELGIALQVDATLQFAKANWKLKIKNEKLKIDGSDSEEINWWEPVNSQDKGLESPYNTYQYPGLPPGPIANPGLSSIKAVLEPTETNYLYYLSEDDGTTHYAETLEEHNENISKYL